jgi:phosphatidylglycerol:prolipoprotein diacylglycerol transferase
LFPDLFKIGDFTIHTYGLLVAIGLLSGYFIALYLAKKEGLDRNKVENLIFYSVIGGLIGTRLFYVIEHYKEFNSFIDMLKIWEGGIDWFGAFIGGLVTAIFFIKKYQLPLWKIADIGAVALVLGHAFGRIGCTCAGCCYGKPVPENSPFRDFAITFPDHPDTVAPSGIPLYPTQPAEAIGNFIIFGILFLLFHKKKFDGQIFALYLILYGLERFLLEFWRGVTPPLPIINLTWNQIITLLMIVAGIVIFIYRSKVGQKKAV